MLDGSSGIRLADGFINSPSYSVAFWIYPDSPVQHSPAFFGASTQDSWVYLGSGTGQTALWAGSNISSSNSSSRGGNSGSAGDSAVEAGRATFVVVAV